MDERSRASLAQRLEAGQFYEVSQSCKAIFQRYLKRKDVEGGIALCEEYADKFANLEQEELAINLGQTVLDALTRRPDVTVTNELCERLAVFFSLCPPESTNSKFAYMNQLIQWSRKAQGASEREQKEGLKYLHSLIAHAYLAEGRFGSCQNHLIFCEDVSVMAELMHQWQGWGYPSEKYSFLLRLVLMLLSRNRIEVAGDFIKQMNYKLEEKDVPGPVQAAYLIWASCLELCHDLFTHVSRKYVLIFRVDATLQKLLMAVESTIFGIQHEQGGLMGMLKQMLGGPTPLSGSGRNSMIASA